MQTQQHEQDLIHTAERVQTETHDRVFQQNHEIARLEEEVQNLLLTNDQILQQRDSMAEEGYNMKKSHLESMTLLQNELTRKVASCEAADSQLLSLQNQFVEYRDDKHSTEKALNERLEELQHELKKERSMKDREIDFARLTA